MKRSQSPVGCLRALFYSSHLFYPRQLIQLSFLLCDHPFFFFSLIPVVSLLLSSPHSVQPSTKSQPLFIMSQGSGEEEYELQLSPFICLLLGIMACLTYVIGTNDRRMWKRDVTNHMGKLDVFLIIWLLVKSCIFYTLSTVTTAMASICTIAALRNKEYTTLFEAHGLTGILVAQFILYTVLNISLFVRILKR